jgi:hypothetical protein
MEQMDMVSPNTTERRIPFAEIIASGAFAELTTPMQIWLKVFLTTNSAINATRLAYPRTSPKSRAPRACNIQAHPKIARLLRLAYGEPEPDPLLEDLRRALRKALRQGQFSPDTTAALKFYEKYSGKKLKAVPNAK